MSIEPDRQLAIGLVKSWPAWACGYFTNYQSLPFTSQLEMREVTPYRYKHYWKWLRALPHGTAAQGWLFIPDRARLASSTSYPGKGDTDLTTQNFAARTKEIGDGK